MSEPKTLHLNPAVYRLHLQYAFVNYLPNSPPYRDMVLSLRSSWHMLIKDRPELETISTFFYLPAPEHLDDPLNAYITRVRSSVANTLRCRINGAPADWVCAALHADVCESPEIAWQHIRTEYFPWVDVRMTVTTDRGAQVDLVLNGQIVGDPVKISNQTVQPFTSWKKLKHEARIRITEAIDLLEKEITTFTQGWPRKYERGYKTDMEVTMPKLVSWLVEGKPMVFGDRSATNDLLHDLGLDPPGRSTSEKLGDFSQKFSEDGPSKTP